MCNNQARQGPPLLCVWNVCPQGTSPQLFLDSYKTFISRWTTTVRGWTIVWPSITTSFSSFSWCMDSSIAFMSPLQAWNIFFRYLFPHICTMCISQYSCYRILINTPELSQPLLSRYLIKMLQFWRDVGAGQGHGQFHILFLFFVSSMFSISLCSLLGYHIHLVLNNRTTLEAFRWYQSSKWNLKWALPCAGHQYFGEVQTRTASVWVKGQT